VQFLASEVSRDTYLNLMDHYRPDFLAPHHPPLQRPTTGSEYEAAVRLARRAGLDRLSGITVA
jgi:putative pyruvate formate lyase activating enzyme